MNRVVIIDDEIQSRNGIAEIFRNHSPQWEIGGLFEDGSQALEYLLQHPEINLIVTDIRMLDTESIDTIHPRKISKRHRHDIQCRNVGV